MSTTWVMLCKLLDSVRLSLVRRACRLTKNARDLYHAMIYMFLHPGDIDADKVIFPGQGTVQLMLLFTALLAVPWMLLPKPFILKRRHEAATKRVSGPGWCNLTTYTFPYMHCSPAASTACVFTNRRHHDALFTSLLLEQ